MAIVEASTLQIVYSPCRPAGRETLELAITSFEFSHLQIQEAVDPSPIIVNEPARHKSCIRKTPDPHFIRPKKHCTG